MTNPDGEREGSTALRVLWLTPDKPADISVGRRRIAEHLRKDGIDVTLRGTTPQTLLASLRERDSYDVVVGTTRSGAMAGVVLKLLGTPFVVDHIDPIRQFADTHSSELAFAVRAAENVAFTLADHTLYVYEEERDRVRRYARAATATDLGVAYDRFADPDPASVERARDRLATVGIDADDRVAIYVGGLEPIYHIDELLAAIERLDGWTLVVLGAGSLVEHVERAARECENVVFLGTVDHDAVPGYLHAADVGISLVDDPHTLKVLEYAAAGLGVVQARGRAEERFGEHVTFCDPTPTAIARAVRRAGDGGASDEDGADDEKGATEAFRTFVRRFDYERVAATYGKVLEGVARGEGR
ncbi:MULTISPECIES: rhamnosyltransferase WsaF family glycosyltransferase [Halococcus]|uniref:Group 1 glycosyl transferase n=1 Tax=Halococcus salifodinae DSM 8989 TaxID=1227456 RepID=M0ND56_9EURY|nr:MULTISPECIES: glycosyltransferase [Halococcus]EMA55917.1 group 1 glycosyl transferase [Halococcus salifodinae DSM 8989]